MYHEGVCVFVCDKGVCVFVYILLKCLVNLSTVVAVGNVRCIGNFMWANLWCGGV